MQNSSHFRYSDFQTRYHLHPPKPAFDSQSFCSLGLDDDTKQSHQNPFISRESFKNIFNPMRRKNGALSETEGNEEEEEEMLRLGQERLRHTFSPKYRSSEGRMREEVGKRLSQEKRRGKGREGSGREIEETLDNLQIKIRSMKEFMFKKGKEGEVGKSSGKRGEDERMKERERQMSKQMQRQTTNTNRFLKKPSPHQRLSITSTFLPTTSISSTLSPSLSFKPFQNPYYIPQLLKRKNHKNSRQFEHLSQTFKIFKYLDDLSFHSHFQRRPTKLTLSKHPRYQNKKTLIFDLDQTLIHCTQIPNAQCDVILTIKSKDQPPSEARINIRPYALTFLKRLAEQFQLIIYTASESCYADVVLDYLDPENKLFQHRLYREHCFSYEDGYIKDLRIINREFSEMVIIDNSAYSYCLQLDNAIPIVPYYEGTDDVEFKALEKYLSRLKGCRDVREVNQGVFRFHEYLLWESQVEVIAKVYEGRG